MIEHAGTCSIYNSTGKELVFSHGEGPFVFDDSGKKYVDFILGFGPVVLGHNNSTFNTCVAAQIANGIHMPSYTIHHGEFIKRLSLSPDESLSFFKTSSESITAALRIVAQATGKKGLIRCGYIGWHDVQIANTCSWHEYPYSGLRNEIRFTTGFRGVSNEEAVYNWIGLDVPSLISIIESAYNNLGAFIIDMFQLHFMDVEILREAIDLCHKYGLLVILDETKTSGRVSLLGIHKQHNLNYDFIILGKALANGAPLSLLVGKNDIMTNAKKARITGTFSKELLSIWCALTTSDIMKENNGYIKLSEIGSNICSIINNAAQSENVSDYVECLGVFNSSMIDLKFSKAIVNEKDKRELLRRLLVDEGILILQGHPSFISLADEYLDFRVLYEKFSRAFSKWKTIIIK